MNNINNIKRMKSKLYLIITFLILASSIVIISASDYKDCNIYGNCQSSSTTTITQFDNSSLASYVPYTGASGNVVLTGYNVSADYFVGQMQYGNFSDWITLGARVSCIPYVYETGMAIGCNSKVLSNRSYISSLNGKSGCTAPYWCNGTDLSQNGLVSSTDISNALFYRSVAIGENTNVDAFLSYSFGFGNNNSREGIYTVTVGSFLKNNISNAVLTGYNQSHIRYNQSGVYFPTAPILETGLISNGTVTFRISDLNASSSSSSFTNENISYINNTETVTGQKNFTNNIYTTNLTSQSIIVQDSSGGQVANISSNGVSFGSGYALSQGFTAGGITNQSRCIAIGYNSYATSSSAVFPSTCVGVGSQCTANAATGLGTNTQVFGSGAGAFGSSAKAWSANCYSFGASAFCNLTGAIAIGGSANNSREANSILFATSLGNLAFLNGSGLDMQGKNMSNVTSIYALSYFGNFTGNGSQLTDVCLSNGTGCPSSSALDNTNISYINNTEVMTGQKNFTSQLNADNASFNNVIVNNQLQVTSLNGTKNTSLGLIVDMTANVNGSGSIINAYSYSAIDSRRITSGGINEWRTLIFGMFRPDNFFTSIASTDRLIFINGADQGTYGKTAIGAQPNHMTNIFDSTYVVAANVNGTKSFVYTINGYKTYQPIQLNSSSSSNVSIMSRGLWMQQGFNLIVGNQSNNPKVEMQGLAIDAMSGVNQTFPIWSDNVGATYIGLNGSRLAIGDSSRKSLYYTTFPLEITYNTGNATYNLTNLGENHNFIGNILGDSNITANDMLRVVANTTTKVCGTASAGSIYYDGTTNKHYGCNSTTWNALY